jgi:fructose-bisphosphate aldolase, class I
VDSEIMRKQVSSQPGFIAALDQSGGSTPEALRAYGVPEASYASDAEMYRIVHEMRARIMRSPAFRGDKVIAAILFEATMEGEVQGLSTSRFLREERGIVPFLKIDKGREAEVDGVRLMKPMPELDALLTRAVKHRIFGTKMRSVINLPSRGGISAVVKQQFEVAEQVARHELVPIIEPEILIGSPGKAAAEVILREEILQHLDTLPNCRSVMLKLTIPEKPDFYWPLIAHSRVMRVVALSGGYNRDDACRRLAGNRGLIASFSRAFVEDLTISMSDQAFDVALSRNIDEIYEASRSNQ